MFRLLHGWTGNRLRKSILAFCSKLELFEPTPLVKGTMPSKKVWKRNMDIEQNDVDMGWLDAPGSTVPKLPIASIMHFLVRKI